MVEPRHVAEQPQALARAPQRREAYLCRFESVDRQLLEPVDLARDQLHRLAVSGQPDCLPGFANRQEARTEVASRGVEEPLDSLWLSPRNEQVARRVVAEEVLQDVRPVVDPAIILVKMLVRVDERQRFDLMLQIGLRAHGFMLRRGVIGLGVSALAGAARRGIRGTVDGWAHTLVLGTPRGPRGRGAGC